MTNREKFKYVFESLIGVHGLDNFNATAYELGKIALPGALLIGGFALMGVSTTNWSAENALLGFGLIIAARFILSLFEKETSSFIKLPIDELFSQFKQSKCNQLRFIHFKEHKRIFVYFDRKCIFTLGECDSEHLVPEYMDYIQSEDVYSKHGKMPNMKPDLSFDERGKDSATIATFTRNMAAC